MISKSIVSTHVKAAFNACIQHDYLRYDTAVEIHKARYIIDWADTHYGAWTVMAEKELPISRSTLNRYIAVISVVRFKGYSDTECKQIIKAIGWSKFTIGMMDLSKKGPKMGVAAFIKRYSQLISGQSIGRKTPKFAGEDVAWSYSLPADISAKIEGYLTTYGMTYTNAGHRRGVRDAMIKLIENELS